MPRVPAYPAATMLPSGSNGQSSGRTASDPTGRDSTAAEIAVERTIGVEPRNAEFAVCVERSAHEDLVVGLDRHAADCACPYALGTEGDPAAAAEARIERAIGQVADQVQIAAVAGASDENSAIGLQGDGGGVIVVVVKVIQERAAVAEARIGRAVAGKLG